MGPRTACFLRRSATNASAAGVAHREADDQRVERLPERDVERHRVPARGLRERHARQQHAVGGGRFDVEPRGERIERIRAHRHAGQVDSRDAAGTDVVEAQGQVRERDENGVIVQRMLMEYSQHRSLRPLRLPPLCLPFQLLQSPPISPGRPGAALPTCWAGSRQQPRSTGAIGETSAALSAPSVRSSGRRRRPSLQMWPRSTAGSRRCRSLPGAGPTRRWPTPAGGSDARSRSAPGPSRRRHGALRWRLAGLRCASGSTPPACATACRD